MSTVDRRLDKLEETLAPELKPRFAFADSKAHAEQLSEEEDAEQARNPTVARGPLTILRWLESGESAASGADYHDPAATENSRGWQQ